MEKTKKEKKNFRLLNIINLPACYLREKNLYKNTPVNCTGIYENLLGRYVNTFVCIKRKKSKVFYNNNFDKCLLLWVIAICAHILTQHTGHS